MPDPIQVSIVEDDFATRTSLVTLVNGAAGFRCVSAHPTGEDAAACLPGLRPDVVLMDINLGEGMSGIDCVARLKPQMQQAQVIMLTVYEDSDRIFQALAAGATGFLVKRTPPARLLEAIEQAHCGESPMSGHIARKVVQRFQNLPPSVNEATLTGQERRVLELLAEGQLYKEIADALGISLHTVRTHIRSIYEKLQVHSRTAAVVAFLASGRKVTRMNMR